MTLNYSESGFKDIMTLKIYFENCRKIIVIIGIMNGHEDGLYCGK